MKKYVLLFFFRIGSINFFCFFKKFLRNRTARQIKHISVYDKIMCPYLKSWELIVMKNRSMQLRHNVNKYIYLFSRFFMQLNPRQCSLQQKYIIFLIFLNEFYRSLSIEKS